MPICACVLHLYLCLYLWRDARVAVMVPFKKCYVPSLVL